MQEVRVSTQKTEAGKQQQLQFLRFLAFLNIFIFHAEMWLFFYYPTSNCGKFAVSFFFTLSGLVTGYSAYGRDVTLTIPALGKHMWKKIRKIYPLYFISMMIPFLSSGIPSMLASQDFGGAAAALQQLAKNLLLLQAWFPEGAFAFNGVGWFLSTLMFLNLFNLPALFLINKASQSRRRYWLLAGAFAAVALLAVFYCGITRRLDTSYYHYIFPPARLGEYLLGMIFGSVIRSAAPSVQLGKKERGLFTLWECAALILWGIYLRWWGTYWTTHSVHWLVPNLFLLGAFTFGRGWISQIFRWKPLVWLGDISFECFLIHQLFVVRYDILYSAGFTTEFDRILAFCYCLLMTLAVSAVLHKGTK